MNPNYKELITADGSPSLSLPPTWEPMHSLEGAFSETLYIYQPTVELAFKSAPVPSITSVGLGIGYNEILIVCEAIKTQQAPKTVNSYESQSFLRDYFLLWINEKDNPLYPIYDQILGLYVTYYEISKEQIKNLLVEWYQKDILLLHGALSMDSSLPLANGILFDAFSNKTSEDLWTPDFIDLFIKESTDKVCHLSTYSCTGLLKRTLEKYGFAVEKRKGYGKKRQSIFASK